MMIDETFHTDRDVGEFIEGLRNSSHAKKRGVRAQRKSPKHSSGNNASLLDAIDDIEAQLHALSSQANDPQQRRGTDYGVATDTRRGQRTASRPNPQRVADRYGVEPNPSSDTEYSSALERIEAQLARVDHALGKKPTPARGQRSTPARTIAQQPSRTAHRSSANSADRRASRANQDGLDAALRQIMQRVESLNEEVAKTAKDSVSQITQSAQSNMEAAHNSANHYDGALRKLSELQTNDDSLQLLRDDVASLRGLLEEANFSGASEHVLNEIASLSSRIDSLTTTMTQTQREPELMDAIRDIHALLDRPALDPSIDGHFERVLSKLDNLPIDNHYEDFAKLSAQMDNLRDILSASPRAQHLSHISGQMGMMVDRLGAMEEDIRTKSSDAGPAALSSELEGRLSHLQQLVERLDPSERLMRVEDQLASLADRLETNDKQADVSQPMEALSQQVSGLVGLIEQRGQQDTLKGLAERISVLDRRIQAQQAQPAQEQRFDQVEQTLARIDDMLAQRMESTDLSSLETSLSRLADRMEAQEQAFRAVPSPAMATPNSIDVAGLEKLEDQIADLANRLDGAGRSFDDQGFFENLTGRLDELAQQFAQSQSRFDAVDRIGAEIQQLTTPGHNGPVAESKLAEAAAIKALQQVGPLSVSPGDAALETIIDGLKDDLHGLRNFAETSENTTQQGLNSVSSMLHTIVDRLGSLEEQVRSGETSPAVPALHRAAPVASVVTAEPEALAVDNGDEKAAAGGLGKLLRRNRKQSKADTSARSASKASLVDDAQSMSAADLLASRTKRSGANTPRRAPSVSGATVDAASKSSVSDAGPASAARMTGQSVGTSNASAAPQPQMRGNAALKMDPQPSAQPRKAQVVDNGNAGPSRDASTGGQVSKADFIAAARRAAQAAAQESERVEQDQTEAKSFLSRFKGSKKADKAEKIEAETKPSRNPEAMLEGMNRKERRAAVAEAARKAKQVKDLDLTSAPDGMDDDDSAALITDLVEDEATRKSLIAKLGGAVSRHSRPLLMAAAAILLAITTLQLAQNPHSSLHGLFNSDTASNEPVTIEMDQNGAETLAPADEQSSMTPSSGSLVPPMEGEDASRAITFAGPSGAQAPMHGPRITTPNDDHAPAEVATLDQPDPQPQSAQVTPRGDAPGIGQGIDLTPTSSIPTEVNPDMSALVEEARQQPLPAIPELSGNSVGVSESVQAAVEMNKLLAPGVADTPLMKAANSGDALAQFEMGRRRTLGTGMSVDLAEAAQWFEKAADQSMPHAQYSLANLYEKGQGVKKDLQVARLWYQRAAEQGNIKAMHNLAVLHAEGGLGKPDFKQAARWFVRASDHGLKDSQYNLAILYARGMGVKQDLLQSYKWFAVGANNGDQGAVAKRDEVFGVLNPAQRKAAKALVASWVPKVAKPSANKLANIPDEWAHKAPAEIAGVPAPVQSLANNKAVIAKAQSLLGSLGYNAGPADGQMGPRTRMAIRNFQEVAGLPVTGKIGPELLEALAQRAI